MLLWIIKQIVLSLVVIILIHYLYLFFKTNLTVPKIKDLVHRPEQKYKEMYQSITPPKEEAADMKLELKKYLNGLKEKTIPSTDYNNNNYERF
jgi:hypothetical protein